MSLFDYGSAFDHSYGRGGGAGVMGALMVLALLAAVVCTVLILILVTPEKRRDKLNKFFRGLADLFNFKGLLLEGILKAFYIFLTLFFVFTGFFTLFESPLTGLMMMVLMPILLRVVFEFAMLAIILVKNVIQINQRLGKKSGDANADAPAFFETPPVPTAKAPAAPETPNMVFCAQCGTQYDANKGGCPNGCKE